MSNSLIETTERSENELLRYSDNHPAFVGEIEFDLTVEVFGKRITGKALAKYDFTPAWPYYDLNQRAVYEGWEGSGITIEFRTVPGKDNQPPVSSQSGTKSTSWRSTRFGTSSRTR